jgi:hypothetical protein
VFKPASTDAVPFPTTTISHTTGHCPLDLLSHQWHIQHSKQSIPATARYAQPPTLRPPLIGFSFPSHQTLPALKSSTGLTYPTRKANNEKAK